MQFQNERLKTVQYQGIGDAPNPRNVVAYMRYIDKRIVFTGLHDGSNGPRGSTCNFAEDIVAAIARKEKIDGQKFEFYDLKTMQGYGANGTDYEPGSFRLDKLRPKWKRGISRPYGMAWTEYHIDEVVVCDFVEFIWGNSERGPLRNLAVFYGSIKAQELLT